MTKDPSALLPLRSVEFQVLLSLSRGERHGYGIIQDAEDRGEGDAVPGLATLYRALRRMEGEGLIERSDEASARSDDDRRRLYRLTPWGRAVAAAEAERLALLVRVARETELIDPSAGS